MPRTPRAAAWLWAIVAVGAVGCNALIGADDPSLRSEEASTGDACVLNSDCTTPGQICIFRVCSPPCHADGDCPNSDRCLQTTAGTACVANSSAGCTAGQTCPAGSTCSAGACRTPCTSTVSCLAGQECSAGACVGTDPSHDPGLGGGADATADGAPDSTVQGDDGGSGPPDVGADVPADAADAGGDAVAEAEAGCGDTNTDPHNCGQCGHDCSLLPNVLASGLSCSNGRCVYQCAAERADCSDAGAGCATDLTSSPNCGACGVTCSLSTPLCAPLPGDGGASGCASGCPTAAPVLCSGTCANTATSVDHCGGCGNACTATAAHTVANCADGGCSYPCAPGYTSCSSACVDVTSDDANCSTCGHACTGSQHCVGSVCQCTGGTHLCGGQCVPNDTNACGASCAVCTAPSGGTAICNGTQCVQSCTTSGYSACSNVCVNETNDPSNCGSCAHGCTGATPYCAGSGCVACLSGSQCANGSTPETCVSNAWVLGAACSGSTPVCSGGSCVACTSGSRCSGNVVQTCVSDAWQTSQTCTSTQVCRGAACVNAVHDVGWDSVTGSFSLSANILYLIRLPALAHDAALGTFGVVANASGASAKLALYADNGAGTAPSGAKLAATSSPVTLTSGAEQQSSDTAGVTLTAGATYWLGIVVNSATTIAAQSDSLAVGMKLSQNFTAAWPTSPAGSAIAPATDLGIFINVQDLN
jgi:hypothetical protein